MYSHSTVTVHAFVNFFIIFIEQIVYLRSKHANLRRIIWNGLSKKIAELFAFAKTGQQFTALKDKALPLYNYTYEVMSSTICF